MLTFIPNKMKTIVLAVLVCFAFNVSYSQDSLKGPKIGLCIALNSIQGQIEVPVMIGIATQAVDADGNILTGGDRKDKSISFSIIPKYQLGNKLFARVEIGITRLDLQSNYDAKYSTTHQVSTAKITSSFLRLAPGLEWTFFKSKRLESYCGLTASYSSYKTLEAEYYSEQRDLPSDTVRLWTDSKLTTPGGKSMGIGALAGFRIYVTKYFSLGAEFASSALYYNIGGQTTEEVSSKYSIYPTTTEKNTNTNSYKGLKISKIISSFNISFYF
jgi:hypothetical protein